MSKIDPTKLKTVKNYAAMTKNKRTGQVGVSSTHIYQQLKNQKSGIRGIEIDGVMFVIIK